jgi:hypothetical protein
MYDIFLAKSQNLSPDISNFSSACVSHIDPFLRRQYLNTVTEPNGLLQHLMDYEKHPSPGRTVSHFDCNGSL